jgi:hypothetical protein
MSELTPSQKEALSLLMSSADRLRAVVTGLSEKELGFSLAAGEWSIRQIVHHLVDGTIIWTMAFNRALATPETEIRFLGGFPGNDAWADALEFDARPVGGALDLITSHHRFLAEAAAHFSDHWDRYVRVPDPGGEEVKINAGQIISMLSEHLVEHLASIEGIRRRLGR